MPRAILAALFAGTALTASILPASSQTAASQTAASQAAPIAAPEADVANYDPTMSAKEAVLANWELAAAGIRAGRVVGDKVLAMAEAGAPYPQLARQAQFAQKTMLQRYNAALWIYTEGSGLTRAEAGATLAAAVAAGEVRCAEAACGDARAELETAYAAAIETLNEAAAAARSALVAREDGADRALMTEQLSLVARYLESRAWAEDLALSDFNREGEEVAARIVGAMSLWRNIEPYVGLASPEIDAAINANAQMLLRTLRRTVQNQTRVADNPEAVAAIGERADLLATELRRAAALFQG